MSNTNGGFLSLPKGFSTMAIHEEQEPEKWAHKEVIMPISLTVSYKQSEPGIVKKYSHSRQGNPTRDVLERVIAKMENGNCATCYGSGLGSITTLLALLKQGDHILCIDDVYGGTYKLFTEVGTRFGVEVSFSNCNVTSFAKNIRSNTRMIFVETPTNPTLQIVDIEELSKLAKKHGALLVVDNTFLTPYFQRPLVLGADIVMHSLTKYMNGHSDVSMGALVVKDEQIGKRLKFLQEHMGVVPSPFDCYQVLRGMKTLTLRMDQHRENSLAVARYLENHPKIEKVLHPGLPSHPQHELAKKQMSGHSGMLAAYIKGDIVTTKKFLKSLKCFTLAPSLGDSESLVALNAVMTHSGVPKEQREKLGITDNLVRFSVGIEDTEDLLADLEQALAQI
ncbi:cystathionine gamma-lyase-like [Harmonia axyridis]|uniref:cystathionine gamma-lyase-like n=1 Tax=Harmonia axyridis TaxID=115357 RepID=UPI001E276CB0|nr:cystathionine gamma-lyase-like [Harmonia axyridis]